MTRRLLALLLLVATAGIACGEECEDLSVRECTQRQDCAPTRMRVQNPNGSHDVMACVDLGK